MPSKPATTKASLDRISEKSNMSLALTRSRSRKVQPALRERANAFLSQASADNSSPLKSRYVPSRKRKRMDLDVHPSQGRALDEEKDSMTSKTRLEVEEDSSDSLTAVKCAAPEEYEDTGSLLSRVQVEKELKASANVDMKVPQEKRLKIFRNKAPQTFQQKLHRATSQRMIVVGRSRSDAGGYPQEEISIVGSTGNIYTVTISHIPTCTCPDALKGNECKHKVYAFHTVLKAPERLQYQRALLTSELHEIFAHAPALPTDNKNSNDTDGNRKPVNGECPICYMDFEEEHNELVYCRAACGNNIHKSCFDQWSKSQAGKTLKCVYCRTPWQLDAGDVSKLMKVGSVGEDGYANVADQLGMTGERDYSTYHPFWVNRHFRR